MNKIIFGFNLTKDGIMITSDRIQSFYTHTHVYSEMLFYEPFEGHITVNDKKVAVDKETVLLLTPNDFHSTTVNGVTKSKYLKIAFRNDMVNSSLIPQLTHPIIFKDYTTDTLLSELILKISSNKKLSLEHQGIILNTILLEFLEKGEGIGDEVKKGTQLLVLDAVKTINEHFFENISLQSVAETLNVTPQHLSITFSKQIGISFSEYLRDKRLKYAADLLLDKKLNVTEICYRCGFRNLSHFLRSFKKKYGTTPKSFSKK